MSDQRVYLPQLIEHRAKAATRRAKAFSKAHDYVLDCPVAPLTPASFSRLYGIGSPFLRGGKPTEMDVRHYIWFTSPLYRRTTQFGWRIFRRIALFRFVIALGGWRRLLLIKPNVLHYLLQLTRAFSDINKIIENTFADSPASSAKPGKPIATTEAYFIHEFASAYRWSPSETRNTPIRELIQLHRCIRASSGEGISDDGEDQVWLEHLKRKEAAAAAQQKVNHG